MIRLESISKEYLVQGRWLEAVQNISFHIEKGEVLGLVGESGSGKSTIAKILLGVTPPSFGKIYFNGIEVPEKRTKSFYRKIQMIFQDPTSSLNPRMNVEEIVLEPTRIHGLPGRVNELLDLVGLNPDDKMKYPHELSGGQKQRIGIARALALNPEFLICDEPISSLDLSIQAQIMNLLVRLKTELGITLLFISHDLAAVRYISDRIAVMKEGRVLEIEDSDTLYKSPNHPYTKLLISSAIDREIPVPKIDRSQELVY